MLLSNGKKIANKKIKNKVGGDSNESSFWTNDKELRSKKSMIIPGFGTSGYILMEQAFNKFSKRKDIVRVTLVSKGKRIGTMFTEREDLEQGISLMAQGNEILKYMAPTPYENDLKELERKSKIIE